MRSQGDRSAAPVDSDQGREDRSLHWVAIVVPPSRLRMWRHPRPVWATLSQQSDTEGWPAARFLAALAEHEIADRGRRRIERHWGEEEPQDRSRRILAVQLDAAADLRLLLLPLAQSYPGAPTVLVNEFKAGPLKCRADSFHRLPSPTEVPVRRFKTSDRWFRNSRMSSQVGLRPTEKGPRRFQLLDGDQLGAGLELIEFLLTARHGQSNRISIK
jgi:hypothetical protein